jgi:hypothetical protein
VRDAAAEDKKMPDGVVVRQPLPDEKDRTEGVKKAA